MPNHFLFTYATEGVWEEKGTYANRILRA